MKKTFLLVAATAAFATAANAQMKIAIAPEIGLNIANARLSYLDTGGSRKTEETDLKLGVKIGANVNIPLGHRLVLQPGLFYSIRGYKQDESDAYSSNINETEKHNVTLHWFDIPLNLQYEFNDPGEGRLFVGVGPFLSVAFSGKDLHSISYSGTGTLPPNMDTNISLKFGNDYPSNNLRRFDFGGQVNVGYFLQSGIFFRGIYQQGGINLIPQGNQTMAASAFKPRVLEYNFTISVGYQLGGRPESNKRKAKGSSGDM